MNDGPSRPAGKAKRPRAGVPAAIPKTSGEPPRSTWTRMGWTDAAVEDVRRVPRSRFTQPLSGALVF
jgi:hypothetical protein